MRKLIIFGAALLAASPLAAQPPAYDEWEEPIDAPAADPRAIAAMAGVMDRLVGAMFDLPIGGIVAAVDPLGRSGYHPGSTLRDMAERDDPYMEERIRSRIQGTTRGISALSQAMVRMMPELRRTAREIERSFSEALEEAY